ncbi:hypothetical protein [Roseateles sp. L2-2]|uniref:hypothetical protein n=1 Tax=Roseateles sp. L2-2 TaxID=3422597 RepID=UPI003D369F0E
MKVRFDSTTLHQSGSGAITGVVHFDFDPGSQFPVAEWNDFVVVIAAWWLTAIEEIEGGQPSARLQFMDGPYWIVMKRQNATTVTLDCIEDRRGADVACSAIVEVAVLRAEVLRFSRDLMRACTEQGMRSADLEHLRRGLEKLPVQHVSSVGLLRLAVLRYALLPPVLMWRDHAGERDGVDLERAVRGGLPDRRTAAQRLCDFIDRDASSASTDDLRRSMIGFLRSVPLLDMDEVGDVADVAMELTDTEVMAFFDGSAVPTWLEPHNDEANLFYAGGVEVHYDWYNGIEDKSPLALVRLYLQQLVALESE